MTEENNVITSNVDAKNRITSNIINQRYRHNILDEVRHRLAKVKETEAVKGAVEDGQLAGWMLWSRTMTFETFKSKYENNITLFREITNKGGTGGPGYFVREVYVHIPEMTSMLPYPDFSIIRKYISKLQALEDPKDRFADSFVEAKDKCEKEFKKIIMFPKFYQVVESAISLPSSQPGSAPAYNSPCLVSSLGKSGLATEGLGKFVKQLDQLTGLSP